MLHVHRSAQLTTGSFSEILRNYKNFVLLVCLISKKK